MNVAVIGRGKVGRALARALQEAQVACTLLPGTRTRRARTDADVLIFAVPDGAIHAVATRFAVDIRARTIALHAAGARGVEDLSPLARKGASVGVFHPLASFASRTRAPSLRGVTFTCFGDPRAMTTARKLARALGAHAMVLPAPPGPAYHAAAALLANGAAALAHAAARVLAEVGFRPRAAERALAALLTSVANNVRDVGVPTALTGPVVRGDAATVARHLASLRAIGPAHARTYAAAQPIIVATALAAGLDPRRARAVLRASRR